MGIVQTHTVEYYEHILGNEYTHSQADINPCTAELFASFFHHLKLEMLTQVPNDEKW